jgi:hypothetical protein
LLPSDWKVLDKYCSVIMIPIEPFIVCDAVVATVTIPPPLFTILYTLPITPIAVGSVWGVISC